MVKRVFEKGNKMFSIYADQSRLEVYIKTIEEMFSDDANVKSRYDVSKSFLMTDPFGNELEMYCITLICTDEEMNKLSRVLLISNV